MSLTKRQILTTGIIGIVSISAAALYYNYKKLMSYEILPKGIRLKALSPLKVDLQVLLDFVNPSNFSFSIIEQEYRIFLDKVLIATLESNELQIIEKKSTSRLTLNVSLNPKKLQSTGEDVLKAFVSKSANTQLKIDMILKLKVGPFKISLPYIYSIPLKNLLK